MSFKLLLCDVDGQTAREDVNCFFSGRIQANHMRHVEYKKKQVQQDPIGHRW
jgi:hypothetical protein